MLLVLLDVMAQFHPDYFCDPVSAKYRDKYAEIARRPIYSELNDSSHRARELGLNFEVATFTRRSVFVYECGREQRTKGG